MNYKNLKTVEDCLIACGLATDYKPDVSSFPEWMQDYMMDHFTWITICRAINKRDDGTFFEADFSNHDQRKWEIWAWVEKSTTAASGFVFSCSHFDDSHSCTNVGSRLCFETREQAVYAFTQFNEQYKRNQLIIKK